MRPQEDGGLLQVLKEIDQAGLHIGMVVEMVLTPARQRRGSILGIRSFRPVKR